MFVCTSLFFMPSSNAWLLGISLSLAGLKTKFLQARQKSKSGSQSRILSLCLVQTECDLTSLFSTKHVHRSMKSAKVWGMWGTRAYARYSEVEPSVALTNPASPFWKMIKISWISLLWLYHDNILIYQCAIVPNIRWLPRKKNYSN